jgi:hypothetical protein
MRTQFLRSRNEILRVFFISVLLSGCITLSLGKAFLADGFETTYKPDIHKIAIMPFDNRSSLPNAEFAVEKAVYERLRHTAFPMIVRKEVVDEFLERKRVYSYSDLMNNVSMEEIGKELEVDAVFVGVVRYYSETKHLLFGQTTSATIEGQFQLFSSREGELLWEKISIGNFSPIIGGAAPGLNFTEEAITQMCNDLKSAWPLKGKK